MQKLKTHELGRISSEIFKKATKLPVVIVLDNVRSAYNVGSVFRIADAFLIEKIYLCGITGIPPHKEISKTALGAEDHVSWQYAASTLEAVKGMKQSGYIVVAAEHTNQSIHLNKFIFDSKKKYCIIFGHEVTGVQDDVLSECDAVIEIPQFGVKNSLNISVSVGIVIWDIVRQCHCFKSSCTQTNLN